MAVAATGSPSTVPHSPDRAVGGDDQAAVLVAPRHELEEQVDGIGIERQIAELIDDQQLGLGIEGQALVEAAFGVRLDQVGEQGRRRGEQHRVALADGLAASGAIYSGMPAARKASMTCRLRFRVSNIEDTVNVGLSLIISFISALASSRRPMAT